MKMPIYVLRSMSFALIISISFILSIRATYAEDVLVVASDRDVRDAKIRILSLLELASKDTNRNVLVGQWVSSPSAWPDAYKLFVQSFQDKYLKSFSILGTDYFDTKLRTEDGHRALTAIVDKYFEAGGLIMLTWGVDNPWYRANTREFCTPALQPCRPGKLSELLDQNTEPGRYYLREMSAMSDIFAELQSRGIVVLFRPFHEMNGSWFWWGVKKDDAPAPDDFVALWRYTYKYFQEIRSLKNIIWVYSPANSATKLTKIGSTIQTADYYYPGSENVDVVGIDFYTKRCTVAALDRIGDDYDYVIPEYYKLIALGKPFGLAEFGPNGGDGKDFDFASCIRSYRQMYPRIGFFVAWQDDPAKRRFLSIMSNNAKGLVSDPSFIFREDLRH